MIGAIARHEWRLLWRSRMTAVALTAVALATTLATFAGASRARAEAIDRAHLAHWAREQLDVMARTAAAAPEIDDEGIVWGAHSAEFVANERGTYVVPPAPPLSALTAGHSDRYASHYRVTARLREARVTGDQLEHPLALLVGHLDLTFVVVYLLPLVILALGFNLTAEERESGTLRMVLARPVRPGVFIAGKLLARAGLVAACAALVLVAGLTVTTWSRSELLRLLLWGAAMMAYLYFWLTLIVFVDARHRSAAHNAQLLAATWLIVVALLPASIALAVGSIRPAPTGVEFSTAVRAASHAAAASSTRLLGRFLDDHPTTGVGRAGMQQYAAVQEAREVETARLLQPTLARLEAVGRERRRLAERLQWLSPAMLTQSILMDVAGTGPIRQRVIQEQVEAFQQQWRAWFSPHLLAASPLTPGDYRGMPSPTLREEDLRPIVTRVIAPLLALILAGTVLLVIGVRRYDVTVAQAQA